MARVRRVLGFREVGTAAGIVWWEREERPGVRQPSMEREREIAEGLLRSFFRDRAPRGASEGPDDGAGAGFDRDEGEAAG